MTVEYELTVRGRLGPVLRAALAGDRYSTVEQSTVIRVRDDGDPDLLEVLRVLEAADVAVREVHEVHDVRPSAVSR